MDAQRWQLVSSLLHDCLQRPQEERADWLDASCQGDETLRDEVEALLGADQSEAGAGFLDGVFPCSPATLLLHDDPEPIGRASVGEGRRIGPYRLLDRVGKGGTSEVYRAVLDGQEGDLGVVAPPVVALKLIDSPLATDEDRDRFRREGDLLAAIDHPNVARYLDRGRTEEGLPFLVMELVEGRRIDRFCDDRGLSIRERAELVAQVCDAVEHIHKLGVLHRDLTPANVLITPEGMPKLVDFGIAKSIERLMRTLQSAAATAPGDILGTPAYLSPEQASGRSHEADARTDVYTLGVLLYRLLTGRTPFEGLSLIDLLEAIRRSDPIPPSQLKAGMPRPLEILCLKCLRKEPARRYASAAALADDLRRWLAGRPIKARPVPLLERGSQWCRRRPVSATMLAAVLVCLMVFVVLYRREQAAHRASEENLRTAMNLIGHLENMFQGHALEGAFTADAWLNGTAEYLRRLIKNVKEQRKPAPELLASLASLEVSIGHEWAHRNVQRDDARRILSEAVQLLQECRQREPHNETYDWMTIQSQLHAASLEIDSSHLDQALAYLSGATDLIASTATAAPPRAEHAARLSELSLRLADELKRVDDPQSLNRVREWHQSLASALVRTEQLAPEGALYLACILADQGDWNGARSAVLGLFEDAGSTPRASTAATASKEAAAGAWLAREARHAIVSIEDRDDGASMNDVAAEVLVTMTRLERLVGLEIPSWNLLKEMYREVHTHARIRRDLKQLKKAERIVAFHTALAERLLDQFPEQSFAHWMMSEAYKQQAKNAWKREDMPAIRRGWARAVEELERALALDPSSVEIRSSLEDLRRRLAALPKP